MVRLRRLGDLVAYPLLSLVGLFALWELAVRVLEIPSYMIPPPGAVLATLGARREQVLADAQTTGLEIVLGFATAAVVGAALGVVIAFTPRLGRLIYPFLIGMNAVPKVALAPLFVVWLGFGIQTKISIAFLVAFFPVVINTVIGLEAVPKDMLSLARAMKGSRWRTFWKIRLPYALPSVYGGMKIAMTLSVVGAIVGEFVAADNGIGYRLQIATANLQTPLLFANLLALTLLALALYGVVAFLTWILLPGRGRW